jgi:acetyl-CoA C-acetyltransferase
MPEVWITGTGLTRIGRRAESLPALMAEAAHAALAEAGLERPDALVVGVMNPEEFVGDGNFASHVATYLGLADVPAIRIETATSSGAAALYTGFAEVAAGLARHVLVVGGEKMTHLATPRVSELIGRSIDPYERSYGTTMPALAGLITRAMMARHAVSERELAQVAVKNHANAARNPYAHFREPVTVEQVQNSRIVADPLRLLHCCPISDGAAAVVLTAKRGPVRIAGIGQGTDTLAVRHRDELTHFKATRIAARAAFAMAGFGPARVDFAEVHDAFASFELIALEDLGLVPPGKAGRATLDGETALDGRLPINPSGGLKARGHPLAATGLAQIVECVWQLTGRAQGRLVPGRIALAHSIGGLATNNWVTLLEAVDTPPRAPRPRSADVRPAESEPRAPKAGHPRPEPGSRAPLS